MVNLVVSEVNGYRYCQSAHTVLGKNERVFGHEILNSRSGYSATPKLDALVKLAKDVTEDKGRVAPDTLTAFYEAGYTNGNLVGVILQVSDKIAMNYLHNLTEIPIDFPVAAELGVDLPNPTQFVTTLLEQIHFGKYLYNQP